MKANITKLFRCFYAVLTVMAMTIASSAMTLAQTESVIYSFTGIDGQNPDGNLMFDSAGNLYGGTYFGGAFGGNCGTAGCGVVFELSPSISGGWDETTLYDFRNEGDGRSPQGTLIFDSAGNLYGMGFAVVFQLSPNGTGGWNEAVIHTFKCCKDGAGDSDAGLIMDASGNLYGTTSLGGTRSNICGSGCGIVFELSPNATGDWSEKILHAFTGGSGGSTPLGGVIFDNEGDLLGSTSMGGDTTCNCGTIFELSPKSNGSWKWRALHNFTGKDGRGPQAALTKDAAGNVYGATPNGGAKGFGEVFEISPASHGGWIGSVIYSFPGAPFGANPDGSVTIDASRHIFAITSDGGTSSHGTVSELSPNREGVYLETVLHSFTGGSDGYDPLSDGITLDPTGNLFGLSDQGGNQSCPEGCGVVFEVTQ